MIIIFIQESDALNGTVVYVSNTGGCATNLTNCAKIREWNSTGAGRFSEELELPTSGSPIRQTIINTNDTSIAL